MPVPLVADESLERRWFADVPLADEEFDPGCSSSEGNGSPTTDSELVVNPAPSTPELPADDPELGGLLEGGLTISKDFSLP